MGRRDSQGDMARGCTIRLPWLRYRYWYQGAAQALRATAASSIAAGGLKPQRLSWTLVQA